MFCLQTDLGVKPVAFKHIHVCHTFIACQKKILVSSCNDFTCATSSA